MASFLIDSNVVLDLLTDDPQWADPSEVVLSRAKNLGSLYINPIIYAETAPDFSAKESLDQVLDTLKLHWDPLPREASFLAGHCFRNYRRRGGPRTSPLPDFFIGAHAAVKKWTLVTRDPKRYQTYFPRLDLLVPRKVSN